MQEAMREQPTQTGQKDTPHHSTSYPGYKLGRIVWERSITSQHQSVHSVLAQSGGGEDLYSASLISLGFYSSLSHMFFSLVVVMTAIIIF